MSSKTGAQKVLKSLASLKLAVIVVILMAILIAAGTIVESRFNDSTAAMKLVYKTPWMMIVMGVFAINLTAVMVDRWPWKRRHLSFLLAHIGILILLLGSLVTMQWGLDGSMRVAIGESNRFVQGPVTDLTLWSSFDGERYTKLFEKEVDFFTDRPQANPLVFPTDVGELKIERFEPYVFASPRVVSAADNPRAGQALQFQIQNARVNVTEWLLQTRPTETVQHNFGPASIYFGKDPGVGSGQNEIYLQTIAANEFQYTIYNKDGAPSKKGKIKINEPLSTGWMGLELKVLQYLPKAERSWDIRVTDRRTDLTNSAIQLSFQGKDHWLQQDDVIKFFTEQAVYILTYGHRRIDVGFDLVLNRFEVGRYPGTMRAASYQSEVSVPEANLQTVISMNEPLKYKGLTIYQASFQDGPDGQPVASIFSINQDPGRWLKYLGSLILSIGVIVLFYDRRKAARAQMAPKKWEE